MKYLVYLELRQIGDQLVKNTRVITDRDIRAISREIKKKIVLNSEKRPKILPIPETQSSSDISAESTYR